MEKIVFVDEMRAIEKEADSKGLSYAQMMENAGVGLAEQIHRTFGREGERVVLALVGSGNNGGDALVALAYLANWGWSTRAYLVRPRGDTDPLVSRFLRAGGRFFGGVDDRDHECLRAWLGECVVLVDGVFGTGARLPLPQDAQQLLGFVQQVITRQDRKVHVVAVDCPSGVDCDQGMAAPEAIPAEITVTMAAVKAGLLSFPAVSLTGELRVASIGELDHLAAWKAVHRSLAAEADLCGLLPMRPPYAHKGSFGTALIVAGCKSYTGAVLLAGEGAYRAGAGLVNLAVPGSLHAAVAGHLPEATWVLLPEDEGMVAPAAAEVIMASLGRASALLVGPGLGAGDAPRGFVCALLQGNCALLPPCVFDADGLRHLASVDAWPEKLPAETILTPHLGEMAALTGLPLAEIQANRVRLAEQYAQAWGHVIVLKGANTVVAEPSGRTSVIPVATAALARAGTGDVLAGIIVGLRAQGMGAFDAAVVGAWIHAQAGLQAAQDLGTTASVLASDVLRKVPLAIAELNKDR